MAWIKMRVELQSHPKVVRMASALKADTFGIIGGLHAVWGIFDAHSEDGGLPGYTPAALDKRIGWNGFTKALQAAGWLETRPEGLFLPRFTEHNGQSAKRRADDAVRKRSARNADISRTDCGPEKEKEEDVTTPPPAAAANGKPRKKPTGAHAESVAWWCTEFQRTRGCPYALRDERDRATVKALLKAADPAEFRRRATALLESNDPFYRDKGCDLGTLRAAWNKLAAPKPPVPSYMRPAEPEPTVGKVDPAIARKAIKDALAASLGKPVD